MKIGKTENGKEIKIDLNRLLETRLLIQGNSGGGKSWVIRKFLEETHGKVQQIVLDIEGDFASMREKYDFILAGKGGDIQAHPKTAEVLAHKVLELGVSIIIDLYELKQHERILFVAKFLDAMTNAPKNLWHPVVVVVDEAHIFAPENGKSESMSAVMDLATRGRKRGFCSIFATQRLSKLHKDVAAECINKMIGRTGLDIDMKRAGDELGFSRSDALKLRELNPGEFYIFGPAFTKQVELVKVGEVQTQHPKAGHREYAAAPPTHKVKALLAKLADLPKEAEKEIKDKSQMAARIRELEAQLKNQPKPSVNEEKALIAKQIAAFKAKRDQEFREATKKLRTKITDSILEIEREYLTDKFTIGTPLPYQSATTTVASPAFRRPIIIEKKTVVSTDKEFGKCEKKILSFLAMRAGRAFTKSQVGAMTNYAPKSGSFHNAIYKLNAAGLINYSTDRIGVSPDKVTFTEEILGESISSADDTKALENWLGQLGKCERTIYENLLKDRNRIYSKEELGQLTGYAPASGSFNNSIYKLCAIGLAAKIGGGISFNPELQNV